MTARKWILKSHFAGFPKREDLEIVEETLPALGDEDFLVETLWLSVDPYMRPYTARLPLGSDMIGGQVAKVTKSNNAEYPVGTVVVANLGWRTHTVVTSEALKKSLRLFKVDPSLPVSPSTALGVLGMPGATAYFGLLKLCEPKAGETLVVTGAAGAVGSLVGQIGKIKGCRVVGFAGSDAKVEHLKSKLGFDAAYNYKTISSLSETLKEACPNGIDTFFDNVGGDFFDAVLPLMNEFGRVSICGAISQYNLQAPEKGIRVSSLILWKQLRVEGFIVSRWLPEWPVAFKEMAQWIKEGKLKYDEHVTEGFDNMFEAFAGLFTGANLGKAVVKA